jgi:hypothetical protein
MGSSSMLHHQQQQQKQQLVQEYKSTARKRIILVNYEDDVNFALKLVLEHFWWKHTLIDMTIVCLLLPYHGM